MARGTPTLTTRAKELVLRQLLAVLALFLPLAPAARADGPVVGPEPQTVGEVALAEPPGVRAVTWIEGLEAPWSLVFLGDGRALVSERPGRIRLIDAGVLEETPWAVLEVASGGAGGLVGSALDLVVSGEGGLMGLAVHPHFRRTPHVYAMYTFRDAGGVGNRVVRLRDHGRHGEVDGVVIDRLPAARLHNGGRIGFGPDGMLYVLTGEQFQAERARDPVMPAGKVLRLTPEGGIPADNPFPGSPVWSLGHRNPQGLAWHRETGEMLVSEHGPSGEFGLRAFDEINRIVPGADYGWPEVVGAPRLGRFVDPLIAWARITTPPAGMAFRGDDLFVATLGSEALIRIGFTRDGGGLRLDRIERWFGTPGGRGRFGRLRDVVLGPDGHLYVLTSNRDGRGRPSLGDDRILRLELAD
jgi:glucose/arabinose dehydrogenase